MPKRKYGRRHQLERKRWEPVVARGDGWCAEAVCLKPSRYIDPDERWHLAHDSTGTHYIGVSHERCNTSEAAVRGNKERALPVRWAL